MTQISKSYIRDTDPSDAVRLNRFLSDAGICSRREADRLIADGQVQIDGQPAVLGQKVLPGQEVICRGSIVKPQNQLILMAFHKPVGIECTTAREVKDNIIDYIHYPSRIVPIGRLDKNSSGLILLTNAGELNDKISRGTNYHEKEYVVTVNKRLTDLFLKQMAQGVEIELEEKGKTVKTRPCEVSRVNDDTFRIVLTQGFNRQIRRMCHSLGYGVRKLQRIRIMNVPLGDLGVGKYRLLSNTEIKHLLEML